MKLYGTIPDLVIRSAVAIGTVSYEFALESIYPLIDRFGEQRKIQSKKFYDRLLRDILGGCVMPAITIAFVDERMSKSNDLKALRRFVIDNITDGYVLDGLQRLTTLKRASSDLTFDNRRLIPINVIIAERYDFLLYRMITLNNGQRPMTARHQIEMLTSGLFKTDELGITVMSEKETETMSPRGAFRKSDLSEAYVAFMSDSLHNQNSRIIESKLDEILVGKIMESKVFESNVSFREILQQVARLSDDTDAREWLRLGNNLIGFTVGAKSSLQEIEGISPEQFGSASKAFNTAFEALDQSKINVGKFRREFSKEFASKIGSFSDGDTEKLTEALFELSM